MGVDVCLNIDYKCDGDLHCNSDELVSECPDCVDDPSKFTCRAGGQMVCLGKYHYQCNGALPMCDDNSDQDPATCNNCSLPMPSLWGDRAMCRDGSTCFSTMDLCNGRSVCSDGSDESDSYSQCHFCTEEDSVPCPGFPGNCGKLCDGKATCPDKWDELLSVCKSHSDTDQSNGADASICIEEDGLYQCKDGSMCLSSEQVCDGVKDCADGSDEDSVACKDKCSYAAPYEIHHCDNGSCIARSLACSAQNQPLCKDSSDMEFSLCQGKCYTYFPLREDPYSWPCTSGTKKCIPHTSRCDGVLDCEDGSDEDNCPFVTQIDLFYTLLICLALMTLLWLIFFLLFASCESSQNSFLFPSNSAKPFPPSSSTPPSLTWTTRLGSGRRWVSSSGLR